MVEDLIYEFLPVIGFGMCASSIFVLIVMRGSKDAFKFLQFFAFVDLISGITMIFAGFHGVIHTIYGAAGEMIQPWQCMGSGWHLPMWIFTDALHLSLMFCFTLDRLFLIIVPIQYLKIANFYLHKRLLIVPFAGSLAYLYPVFQDASANSDNKTLSISSLCHLEEVIGEETYTLHTVLLQFIPIGCVLGCFLILLIYMIRHLKQRWSYNWSEATDITKQLLLVLSVRCFLFGVSVHLPLLFIHKGSTAEMAILRDFFIRICLAICVTIASPILLSSLCPQFSHNVYMLFNKYSHNTKRQWQSASDPPKGEALDHEEGDHPGKDEFADAAVNMFGSFYSATGAPMGLGETGGNNHVDRANHERSISFYYQDSPKSTTSKKCRPA
ncbi:unnamed protein product, partial [Mesorhabditis belari]|uniref:G protein-coupled receptor n=1 Tax=Mesorhabditis belari TaxID=2138241 RepID=A0AAF3FEU8_9BILA